MITRPVCVLVLLLGCASASPAMARECGPLKMLASAKLTLQGKYRPMVPVTVNGKPKQFLVDTGGVYTQIAPQAVQDLHLAPEYGATPIFDMSKNSSNGYVKIDSFELGGIAAKDVYLRVSPSDLGGDGLIAPDVLNRYDVEMDFGGGKMNYFLPDHCPGKVIYWPHDDAARISITLADKASIKVPVTLDGKSLIAIIDTGATSTAITDRKAEEFFGLTPNSPDMKPAGNVNDDPNLASHFHTFSSLALDGITIKNLPVIVVPDRVTDPNAPRYTYYTSGNKLYSQKRIEAPDLILGMDVLKHLHLYFAFNERNLYATSAPVPALVAADAPESPNTLGNASGNSARLSRAALVALQNARIAFEKKDYPAALAILSKIKDSADMQPFDMLMIHRFMLSVHAGMKDLDAMDVDAEAAADMPPDVIPETDKGRIYKAALQLALNARHYDKAVKYAKFYQETNPPESDQALIRAALSHAGE